MSSASPEPPETSEPPPAQRYAGTETKLGTTGVAYRRVDSPEAERATLAWWDTDADTYHAQHGAFLGEADFVWCPEGVREVDVRLLGGAETLPGADVLEIGCGSAPCARWLTAQGARVVALDLSAGMLRHATAAAERTGLSPALLQANAEHLPLASGSFDIACSAFGALPFVPSAETVFAEVARVLRPGGRWVFSVTHPMRWIFSDDPGPTGLTAVESYFDRTPYVEQDAAGAATYVEYHRTLGDWIRALNATGLRLVDLIEPEWPAGHDRVWGQWSPLRGKYFPGTAIFCTERAD
ncbi:SAM-dependent methyltransferase [Saccharomonospora sp. CUA-673]|uniref:class I SAM-dependent methyltransferase n=1 Tax=Saccharomonospora sp. CUA-673 TaxID=1904969 RepID=UPI00095A9A4E|nr:class I SAM-dependent methyltransferase [Saccharomonospora sp. CUA-673]OLT43987.1 SAM-dependent methyltransferase [Saccharomonospora sp. CUA-673]